MYRRALVLWVAIMALLAAMMTHDADAHFEHFGHYNAKGGAVGQYYAFEQLEPDYAKPQEPTAIMFSVQDFDGHDVKNISTMIEIYSALSGERLHVLPWTLQQSGDFSIFYTFPDIGNYQIVLSVADGPIDMNRIDPPRTILSGNIDCNCHRVILNASISTNFGSIWNGTVVFAIFAPLAVLGAALGITYKQRRKEHHANSTEEFVQWSILLLAIAGGLVHFAVYSGHASLRIEYSIFLLVAGAMQISYGIIYIQVTMLGAEDFKKNPRKYYRKTVATNLYGLLGTSVLLGLYTYSVIFPPPLSPNNTPETVELGGILAKSAEAILVVGIMYLMRLEKKRLDRHLAKLPGTQ